MLYAAVNGQIRLHKGCEGEGKEVKEALKKIKRVDEEEEKRNETDKC